MERVGNDSRMAAMLMAGLTIVYVAIRCTYLDRFITTDEMNWLGRSANFYWALRSGHLESTFQMAHPGVMTMWAGALAYFIDFPEYGRNLTSALREPGFKIPTVLEQSGVQTLHLLDVARVCKILMQSCFFCGSLMFIRRLFAWTVMPFAGLLIAFDPFLSGLDSLLHVDGLFAMTTLCALLSIAWAIEHSGDRSWPWMVSGALSACAWLTRTQGLLIPVLLAIILGSMVVTRWWGRDRERPMPDIRGLITSGCWWLGAWLLTSLILLPALWYDPVRVISKTWSFSTEAATEGHETTLFFDGKAQLGDPGMLFYPVTVLWRLTPVTLLGLVLLAAFLIFSRRRALRQSALKLTMLMLLMFVISYALGMSLTAKKFDRYLLPVYPIFDVFAACGYAMLVSTVGSHWSRFRKLALPSIATWLLLAQGAASMSVLPYRLDYYNPLLGGAIGAQDELQMGWGHGADQVLRWVELNTPVDESPVVLSSSSSATMSRLETNPESRLIINPTMRANQPQGWFETDFYALGIQEYQRSRSPIQTFMDDHEPVFIAWVEGVPYIRVFPLNSYPFPETLVKTTACTVDVASGYRLLQVVVTATTFDFYFITNDAPAPSNAEFTVIVHGTDITGTEFNLPATGMLAPGASGMLSKLSITQVAKQAGVYSDVYTFEISGRDSTSDAPLLLSKPGDLKSTSTASIKSGCYVTD